MKNCGTLLFMTDVDVYNSLFNKIITREAIDWQGLYAAGFSRHQIHRKVQGTYTPLITGSWKTPLASTTSVARPTRKS